MSRLYFDPAAPVVTCILSLQNRSVQRSAIRKTYLSALPSPFFFLGDPDYVTHWEGDTLCLQCDDSDTCAPRKFLTLYEWLLRTSEFRYLLILEDHFVVRLATLYSFLFSLYASEEPADYVGCKISDPVFDPWEVETNPQGARASAARPALIKRYPYCEGRHGYVLSRRAVELLVREGRDRFLSPFEPSADIITADVLGHAGIEACEVGDAIALTEVEPLAVAASHVLYNGLARGVSPTSGASSFPQYSHSSDSRAETRTFYCSHEHRFLSLNMEGSAAAALPRRLGAEEKYLPTMIGLKPPSVRDHMERSFVSVGAKDAIQRLLKVGYRRFAVLDEPVRRFLHVYRTHVQQGRSDSTASGPVDEDDLEQFINYVADLRARYHPAELPVSLRPQSSWLSDLDLDYIVPLETLGQFLRKILGVPKPISVSQLGESVISGRLRSQIMEIYAEDYAVAINWPRKAFE